MGGAPSFGLRRLSDGGAVPPFPVSDLTISNAPSVVGGNVNGPAIEFHAAADDRMVARVGGVIDFVQLSNGMVPLNTVGVDKLVNATQQYQFVARTSVGAGAFQTLNGTVDGVAMLQAASVAAQRTLLGLGAAALLGVATDADARAQTSSAVLLTPANLAGRASFSANKNGVSQTGMASTVFTKITLPNEVWDIGGFFASDAWVPPASKVRIGGTFSFSTGTSFSTSGFGIVSIFKNAARNADIAFVQFFAGQTSFSCGSSLDFNGNGTDSYDYYAYADITAAGTYQVNGGTINSGGGCGEQL